MTKDTFLQGLDNWNNHRLLLWLALEETKNLGALKQDVLELGMGEGSTNQLVQYCEATGRILVSCDSNLEWIEKFARRPESPALTGIVEGWWVRNFPGSSGSWKILYAKDNHWDSIPIGGGGTSWACVLVDHAPGERRWVDILRLKDHAKILVIHDSEPAATGYMLDKVWPSFKLKVDCHRKDKAGAWASAVSNSIDVGRWAGQTYGDYVISHFIRS
jgi:hypothetical protein